MKLFRTFAIAANLQVRNHVDMSTDTLSDHIAWVLDHEVRERGSSRTYPTQVRMFVGRHFGGRERVEPSMEDVTATLTAMGFPSAPFTFRVGRKSVTVPMFDVSA